MTHPELAAFREWYTDDEEMDPPTDQSLSRRALRAWYAHSAFVAWSTTHNSRETGFSAKSPTRKRWVGALLRNLEFDLDPTYRHDSWYLSAAETRRMLAGVGGPVPGVEHKWTFDKEEYQQLRQDHQSRTAWVRDHPREEPPIEVALYPPGAADAIDRSIPVWEPSTDLRRQFSDADCLNAVQAAIDQLGPEVTVAAYESWREKATDVPSSSLLFLRFDGWEDAKALAMSDRAEAPAQPDHPQQYSRLEMLAAVALAAGELETDPSPQQYESWRDDTFPAATAIADRCGGWPAALSQAGLVS